MTRTSGPSSEVWIPAGKETTGQELEEELAELSPSRRGHVLRDRYDRSKIPEDHPFRVFLAAFDKARASGGTPPPIRVYVFESGSNPFEHGAEVVRALSAMIRARSNVDVALHTYSPKPIERLDLGRLLDLQDDLQTGRIGLAGLGELGVLRLLEDLGTRAAFTSFVRDDVRRRQDTRLTLVNHSCTQSIRGLAKTFAERAVKSAPDAPLRLELAARLGVDPSRLKASDELELVIAHAIRDELLRPEHRIELLESAIDLSRELVEARREGILFGVAAGNWGAGWNDELQRFARPIIDTTEGALVIGGVHTETASDRPEPTFWTQPGKIDVAAPATQIPVRVDAETGGYIDADGTSFSLPLVTGLIPHVLDAVIESHPDVTPDELAAILRATAIPSDDARAGSGTISPSSITSAGSVLSAMCAELKKRSRPTRDDSVAHLEEQVKRLVDAYLEAIA